MTTYQANVTREDGWWMIHVPEIDGLTQARRLADVEQMARELIAVTLDVPMRTVKVTPFLDSIDGFPVAKSLAEIEADRVRARKYERAAKDKTHRLAVSLSKREVPLRDVGTVLGVSHQRAHQLVNAGD